MQQLYLIFCVGAIAFFTMPSCKTTSPYPATSEVNYVSNPNPGLVTVEATGYGKTSEAAELDTYNTAFTTIFFKGLPAFTALRTPMIPNESKARSEHAAYFKNFFEERGYLQFVTNKGTPAKGSKADDGKNTSVRNTFTINYESLRRDLEQNGVIRKFGL